MSAGSGQQGGGAFGSFLAGCICGGGGEARAFASSALEFGGAIVSEYVTEVQLAEIIGVSEAAVRKAFKAGRIPRRSDRKYDVAACLDAWGKRTDPGRTKVRVPNPSNQRRTLADISLATAMAMKPRSRFDAGFAAGLVAATYRIGATTALIAADFGATFETAKGLKGPTELAFMLLSEDLLRMLPSWRDAEPDADIPGLTYEIEDFAAVDWDAVQAAGERE